MPKFKAPAGMTADVSSFDASGGIEAGIREGATLLGPLISIYKDKAAREAATQEFRNSITAFANKMLPEGAAQSWKDAGEWFASKYPRVAAHMRQSPVLEPPSNTYASLNWGNLQGADPQPAALNLNSSALKNITKRPEQAKGLIAHEGTHAAQVLGNSLSLELYEAARQMGGYMDNPFEVSARYAQSKAEGYEAALQRMGIPLKTKPQPANLVTQRWINDPLFNRKLMPGNAKYLDIVLKQRSGK